MIHERLAPSCPGNISWQDISLTPMHRPFLFIRSPDQNAGPRQFVVCTRTTGKWILGCHVAALLFTNLVIIGQRKIVRQHNADRTFFSWPNLPPSTTYLSDRAHMLSFLFTGSREDCLSPEYVDLSLSAKSKTLGQSNLMMGSN